MQRTRYEAAMDKRANVKAEEAAGNIADSMDVRIALMNKVHAGEISLADAQAQLKKIKRNAKANGMKTRAQAFNEACPPRSLTMNTKHTPGPWHVTGKGLSRYVEGRVRPGVLQEVAWCGATEVSEQMEANARLIAAAPELLEQLQEMVRLAEHEGWEGFEKARAAIEKATGASHVSQQ